MAEQAADVKAAEAVGVVRIRCRRDLSLVRHRAAI
jgi:hypothetical protein